MKKQRELQTEEDKRSKTAYVKKRSVSVKRNTNSRSVSPTKKERSIKFSDSKSPSPTKS